MSIQEISYGKEIMLRKVKITIEFNRVVDLLNLVNEATKTLSTRLGYTPTLVLDGQGKRAMTLMHKNLDNNEFSVVIKEKSVSFYSNIYILESPAMIITEIKKALYMFFSLATKVLGRLDVKDVTFVKEVALGDNLQSKFKSEAKIPSTSGNIIHYRKTDSYDKEVILIIKTSLEDLFEIRNFPHRIDKSVDQLYNICTELEKGAV